ncbi:MAG: PD-(D/E)XK nuclease family protein [Halolamina sp.]
MTQLSATTLNLFVKCKRCFWLHVNEGIERPELGFPSTIGAVDQHIKEQFDTYRGTGRRPPALEDVQIDERLVADSALVSRWRTWQTAPKYEAPARDATLVGALDDLLVTDADELVAFDYKTRASLPETPHGHYRRQLAVYTLLLREAGHATADYGVLLYFVPAGFTAEGRFRFETALRRVPVAVTAVRELFEAAADTANGGIPLPDADCQFCEWCHRNSEHASFEE